mmetsp:Transcript_10446/g.34592  ORF Transcript_10446/g.34592 Transcript_10446/m.34592 type:complete len:309 (+) Transcript_10446:1113-2039(+)
MRHTRLRNPLAQVAEPPHAHLRRLPRVSGRRDAVHVGRLRARHGLPRCFPCHPSRPPLRQGPIRPPPRPHGPRRQGRVWHFAPDALRVVLPAGTRRRRTAHQAAAALCRRRRGHAVPGGGRAPARAGDGWGRVPVVSRVLQLVPPQDALGQGAARRGGQRLGDERRRRRRAARAAGQDDWHDGPPRRRRAQRGQGTAARTRRRQGWRWRRQGQKRPRRRQGQRRWRRRQGQGARRRQGRQGLSGPQRFAAAARRASRPCSHIIDISRLLEESFDGHVASCSTAAAPRHPPHPTVLPPGSFRRPWILSK